MMTVVMWVADDDDNQDADADADADNDNYDYNADDCRHLMFDV